MEKSALQIEQELAGGKSFSDDAAILQTYRFCHPSVLHFGDPGHEFDTSTNDSAVFDVSDRTQIEIAGKDAKQFMHNFCTNDIMRLEPGEGCEAFVSDVRGRILAHVLVFLANDSVWIETTPNSEAMLLAHFDRYLIREDVQLRPSTEKLGELFVTGPRSPEKLASLNIESQGIRRLQHTILERDGYRIAVRRVDLFGHPGFLLSVDRALLASLWKELTASGICPGGAEAFHALRINACFPLSGLDVADDNLVPEAARSERAVSFSKGCYLGQEPIARIDAIGHVNRELRGLTINSETAPGSDDAVLADDGSEVGVICSSARVPGSETSVALSVLRSSHVAPGTAVRIAMQDRKVEARVFWHDHTVG